MAQRKIRNLVLVFWGGLFFLTYEPVFLWLLVGSLVLFSSSERSVEDSSHNFFESMRRDAKKFNLRVPSQKKLRTLLNKIYRQQERSFQEYPHLRSEYQQITDELWLSLSDKKSVEDWSYTLASVLENWPGTSSKSRSSNIGKKLEEVSDLTRQWNEAKKEAFGGQHV